MKCAGAPLKHTFPDRRHRQAGRQWRATNMVYAAPQGSLFGVPIVAEKVRMLFEDRGISPVHGYTLTAIDAGASARPSNRRAGDRGDGLRLHPRHPAAARAGLRAFSRACPGKTAGSIRAGWRSTRKPCAICAIRIFAVGDIAGVPKGKTAASVKWQVPVVEDHLVAPSPAARAPNLQRLHVLPADHPIGRAMLVEFDYNNNLTPSFPGIIAPLEELWISWLMKEVALKATYNAMLRGRA
jgi:sulfide:quinone oxidoreductase